MCKGVKITHHKGAKTVTLVEEATAEAMTDPKAPGVDPIAISTAPTMIITVEADAGGVVAGVAVLMIFLPVGVAGVGVDVGGTIMITIMTRGLPKMNPHRPCNSNQIK